MAIVTGHHTGQDIGGPIVAGTAAARSMTVGAGTGCIERPGGALTVPGRAQGSVASPRSLQARRGPFDLR